MGVLLDGRNHHIYAVDFGDRTLPARMNNSPMTRPQFNIRTLLWLTLVVAAFLGGIGYQRRMAVVDYDKFVPIAAIDPATADHVSQFLEQNGIETIIEGSVVYGVSVAPDQELRARSLLREDSAAGKYWIQFN